MKSRILRIVLAAACLVAAISCAKEGLSTQNAGKEKPVVKISTNRVSDNLVTFTLTCESASASQFGYVVLEGLDNEVPAAQSILMDEVSASIKSGVFSTVDQVKARIDFECSSDKNYQVFAAAITDSGLLGLVEQEDLYVPDTEIPSIAQATVLSNVLTLTFTEDIFVNKESSATIQYVKWGTLEITPKENLPLEYITTEGKVATFNCPKPAAGAGYLVSFPKGLFVDKSGNKALGIESSLDLNTYTYHSLGWDDSPVDFAVERSYFKDAPASSFAGQGAVVSVVFPFDVYANSNVENPVSVIYNENTRKEYVYTTFKVSPDRRTVNITLPRAPKATFDIRFERGAIYDEWGNVNSAYEITTVDDFKCAAVDLIFGDYKVTSSNGSDFVIDFVRSSGATVTMSADWFNLGRDVLGVDQSKDDKSIMPELVGVVNYEDKTVTFDGSWNYRGVLDTTNAFGSAFYYYGKDESKFIVMWGSGSGKDPVVVHFNEDGKFTDISEMDYSIHSATDGGFMNVYDSLAENTPLSKL